MSKRLKTTTKVALTMASLAKTQNGHMEINYRALWKLAGVSKHALQRSLSVLVEDYLPPIPEDDEFDPVFRYMDTRPRRTGGMFLCLRRGTYPNRMNSVYQMKDAVLEALGWT